MPSRDATVVCVASGPSLSHDQIALITQAQRDGLCRVAVTNTKFQTFPGADALWATDGKWWNVYLPEVRARFTGELWTQDKGKLNGEPWGPQARKWGLDVTESEPGTGIHPDPLKVYQHGNGGAAMINKVYRRWSPRTIIMVAYDLQLGPNGEKHSHPDHPAPLANVNPAWCVKHYTKLADDLRALGVRVLNCTLKTALTQFERADLSETLAGL